MQRSTPHKTPAHRKSLGQQGVQGLALFLDPLLELLGLAAQLLIGEGLD